MRVLGKGNLTRKQQAVLTKLVHLFPSGSLYLVGGAVRDVLLGRPVKDVDVVLTGAPSSLIKKKLGALGSVQEIGARFGVFHLTPPKADFSIDLALPRTEQSGGGGGYRDFSFRPDPALSIEADLSRRDFTVNAMALSWSGKKLIDPFHGTRDLASKCLRTVGKPQERFSEDYSRLLRLLRFSTTLGFSIHPQTAAAARKLMPRLNAKRNGRFIVPREVCAEQLVRMFSADPVAAFDLADRYGVFRLLLPEIAALRGCRQPKHYHSEGDAFAHTRLGLAHIASSTFSRTFGITPSPLLIFAALLHDIGKPATRRLVWEHQGRRVHFWGHETQSATRARDIADRLRLASYNNLVPIEDLVWLIRHHLLITTNDPSTLRPATLARYFTSLRGSLLLQLAWVDQSASLRPNGKAATEHFRSARRRLRVLFRKSKTDYVLPPALITGTTLIERFGMHEGPDIGRVLRSIRDAQLDGQIRTRRDADRFIRNAFLKSRHG